MPRSWRANLLILWASQLVTMLAFSSVMPFLPLYVQELGIESSTEAAIWAGVLAAASQVTMALMAPFWGSIADRHGPKLMVQRAMFVGGGIVGLMGLAANVPQLLVLRVAQGAFSGTVTAARVLAASITPAQSLGMALGLMQMATFVGSSGGPLIGGFIADHYGFRTTFFVTAAATIASGVAVLLVVQEPARAAKPSSKPSARFWKNFTLLRDLPEIRGVILVLFSLQIGTMSIGPVLPLFIKSISPETGSVASTAGLVMGATAATSALAAVGIGRLGDRVGHRRVLMVCAVGAGLLYLPQTLVTSPLQLLALRAVLGVFMGGVFPSAMALIGLSAPPESRGWVYGLTASAQAFGGAIGPLLGAGIAAAVGMRAVFGLTGLILLGVGLWVAYELKQASVRPEAASSGPPVVERKSEAEG